MSPCAICASSEWLGAVEVADDRFAPHNRFQVWRCASCGVLATFDGSEHVDPWPHYPSSYGAFSAESSLRRMDRNIGHVAIGRLAWLSEFAGSGAAVLDVGCGSGRLLGAIEAAGLRVSGVEPDDSAAASARRAGFDVVTGEISDVSGMHRFEVVVLSHVLEHVTDPMAVLADVRRLLRPGGRLVVALPDVTCPDRRLFGSHWDGWDVPRHVHHFDRATVRSTLQRAGFAIESLRHEVYAVLGRSARNAGWPAPLATTVGLLDRPVGAAAAVFRRSGAMQVIAVAAMGGPVTEG